MKIDFSRLRSYGNGATRTNISTKPGAFKLFSTPYLKSVTISFAIELLGYLLYGEGLESICDQFRLLTDNDNKTIHSIVRNLLRLSKRLGDL